MLISGAPIAGIPIAGSPGAGNPVNIGVSEVLAAVDSFAFPPVPVSPGAGSLTFLGGTATAVAYPYVETSNTFNFAPSLGEMVLYCFQRCGVRRPEVTASHLMNARIASNMILSDWANEQVNLWEVDLQTIDLVAGQATYPVSPNTVLILDAYLRINVDDTEPTDLILYPISRTEWASLPDKYIPGRPTTFWFDRLIQPSITLWQLPAQGAPTYQLMFYRVRQTQDAEIGGALNVELPYRFLRAFSDALTVELAQIYAPERVEPFSATALASWTKAKNRDAEDVPLFIVAGMTGYYRQQ